MNILTKDYIPCCICGKKALWGYMPGTESYCDKHVPRGCSCNDELKPGIHIDYPEALDHKNYIQKLDDQGRKKPCCEYTILEDYCHCDESMVKAGWDAYFLEHPDKKPLSDVEYYEELYYD